MKSPGWGLLLVGAVIVVSLFTYPLWRGLLNQGGSRRAFDLLPDGQREVLLRMDDRNAAATAYAAALALNPMPTLALTSTPFSFDPSLAGRFREIDAFFRAEGVARIYRLSDESLVLRLEDNFSVTSGPDLTLYLSGVETPTTVEALNTPAVSAYPIGALIGTSGDQQYSIPKELRLDRYRSVVIVSNSLNMIYSYAPLR
jgi:hypothetical protein